MSLADNQHINRRPSYGGRSPGWSVQLNYPSYKKAKLFSDEPWGGTAQALRAARLWRDAHMLMVPESERQRSRLFKQSLRSDPPSAQPPSRKERSAALKQHDQLMEELAQLSALANLRRKPGAEPRPKIKKQVIPVKRHPSVDPIERYERQMPQSATSDTRVSAFWKVSWTDTNAVPFTRKFSVEFWGEDIARQRAAELHERLVAAAEAARARRRARKAKREPHLPPVAASETPLASLAPVASSARLERSASPVKTGDLAMRNIRRVETKERVGWNVKIRRAKVRREKNFSDKAYGGKDNALVAAKAFRDELLAQLDTPEYEVWKRDRKVATNTSGIPGVYRGVAGSKKSSGRYIETPYWQAYWTDVHGKRQMRVFSIDAYGDEGAKALAIEARQRGLAQLARDVALIRQAQADGAVV